MCIISMTSFQGRRGYIRTAAHIPGIPETRTMQAARWIDSFTDVPHRIYGVTDLTHLRFLRHGVDFAAEIDEDIELFKMLGQNEEQ